MTDHPLGPLATELALRVLNRVALVPLRRLLVGQDPWTEFYSHGHDGHPWWHYEERPDGTLVLVGPIGSRPAHADPAPTPLPQSRASTGSGGVSVRLACGRATTSIAGYQPDTHEPLVARLDLLCALMGAGGDGPRSPGPPLRGRRSISLAAREWGTRTGRSQRLADRYLADLGAARIIERRVVGSRAEWHVPRDALERFRTAYGFTVDR